MGEVTKPDVDSHVSTTSLDDLCTHLFSVVLHHRLTAQQAQIVGDMLATLVPWIIKGVETL